MRFSTNISFHVVSLVYERFPRKPWIVILKPWIVIDKPRIYSISPNEVEAGGITEKVNNRL